VLDLLFIIGFGSILGGQRTGQRNVSEADDKALAEAHGEADDVRTMAMPLKRCKWRIVAALAATCFLLAANVQADPQPTPHKKKHHVAANGDDETKNATPSPSPAAKHHRTHHAGSDDTEPTPAPSPEAKAEGGFHGAAGDSAPDHPKAKKSDDLSAKPDQTGTAAKDEPSGKSHTQSGANAAAQPPATSTISANDLRDFDALPPPVRDLLSSALDLTQRNLTYTYGSSDPANGGLDCSGTIYYLLKGAGFEDVPRSASEQYAWVRQQSRFYAVLSKKEDSFDLKEMRPGDLLFWTGTYNVDHDPPVTHTMIYLGRRKKDGKPLMMGASDGRPYDGEKRNGVSVFDFKMPAARSADSADASTAAAPDHAPDFVGYGPIPGMAERNDAASRQAAAQQTETKASSAAKVHSD
jgi:cell wall-associated NlpC family hydrolase